MGDEAKRQVQYLSKQLVHWFTLIVCSTCPRSRRIRPSRKDGWPNGYKLRPKSSRSSILIKSYVNEKGKSGPSLLGGASNLQSQDKGSGLMESWSDARSAEYIVDEGPLASLLRFSFHKAFYPVMLIDVCSLEQDLHLACLLFQLIISLLIICQWNWQGYGRGCVLGGEVPATLTCSETDCWLPVYQQWLRGVLVVCATHYVPLAVCQCECHVVLVAEQCLWDVLCYTTVHNRRAKRAEVSWDFHVCLPTDAKQPCDVPKLDCMLSTHSGCWLDQLLQLSLVMWQRCLASLKTNKHQNLMRLRCPIASCVLPPECHRCCQIYFTKSHGLLFSFASPTDCSQCDTVVVVISANIIIWLHHSLHQISNGYVRSFRKSSIRATDTTASLTTYKPYRIDRFRNA